MTLPIDVDDLERQVRASIVSPPGSIERAVLASMGEPLPLERYAEIIDREIIDREERFPHDQGAIDRLRALAGEIDEALKAQIQ